MTITIKTFENLECWKQADELRRKVFALVKTFSSEEKYRLVDQMIRASCSAPAQIAEDYRRFHYQENIQYCRQGRGSLYELFDHLITSFECKYISSEQLIEFRTDIKNCLAILNGYINHLGKAKSSNQVGEPEEVYGNPINI